ncbi:hypothetical protein TRICI_000722 [Trichomonascus ciferrii]|uniref:Uncharacterized protein n=1 Tax=Trichomonascus ciferrii TaxID=44093 RepID=A0A642VC05_9ASCO|nr:hypothetical protein TRICI_000722 [Trichomonascus ciferrii]
MAEEDLERFHEQWRRDIAERQGGDQQQQSSLPESSRQALPAEVREQRVGKYDARGTVVVDDWKPDVRLTSDDPAFKPEIHKKEEIFVNESLSENDLSELQM